MAPSHYMHSSLAQRLLQKKAASSEPLSGKLPLPKIITTEPNQAHEPQLNNIDSLNAKVLDNTEIEVSNAKDPTQKDQNIERTYIEWRLSPSTQNLRKVITALKPTINYALASYQGKDDPFIETQAKILAAKAVKTYDPSYNVTLPTYLTSKMRKLTRIVRESRSPIKIPERTIYDIAALKEAEADLLDKNGGREPDVQQLADYMGVSIDKIENIRNKMVKQVSENSYFTNSINSEESDAPDSLDSLKNSQNQPQYTKEALDYAYNSSDYREKKILEWTCGYGGAKILTPKQIAAKLGISESQVSRLTAKLALKVSNNLNALERVYNA